MRETLPTYFGAPLRCALKLIIVGLLRGDTRPYALLFSTSVEAHSATEVQRRSSKKSFVEPGEKWGQASGGDLAP